MVTRDSERSQQVLPAPTVRDWMTDNAMSSVVSNTQLLHRRLSQCVQGQPDIQYDLILAATDVTLERTRAALVDLTQTWINSKTLSVCSLDPGPRGDLAAVALRCLGKVIGCMVNVYANHSLVSEVQNATSKLPLSQPGKCVSYMLLHYPTP